MLCWNRLLPACHSWLGLFNQFLHQEAPVGAFKLAMVGVFIPQTGANVYQSSLPFPPGLYAKNSVAYHQVTAPAIPILALQYSFSYGEGGGNTSSLGSVILRCAGLAAYKTGYISYICHRDNQPMAPTPHIPKS